MDELKEEIIFLESEILDDDDDAPLGTLVEPAEAPKAEEAPAQEVAEEPIAEEVPEEAPAEEPEEETAEEVAEAPQEEPAEEPAPEEVQEEVAEEPVEEEPKAEEEPASEVAPAEEPAPEKAEEPEEKPAEPAPAKPKKPRAKKEDAVTSKDTTSINIKGSGVNDELAASSFEVKDSKPATIVKSKKVKEDDVWQVAPVAKTEEEPKKAPAKKAAAKPAEKAEAPKKAPAKKAEPKEEPKPAAKAPAKKAEPKQTNKSTEEKKMAAKVEAKPAAKPAPKKDDKPQEKVLVEGTGDPKTRAKFVIKVTDNGNYVYKLFSSNKRVIAIGAQPYPALPSCKTGIQSVIKNSGTAPIEDQTLQKPVEQKCPKWIIFLDKKGEFRLRLIASNGNIVATTNDGYLSKDAAKKGIDAIARASSNADIVRNDDLW